MSTKPAPKRGGAPQQNGGPKEGAKQANPGQQRSQQAPKGGKKPDTALFVVEEPFSTQKKEPANLSKNNRPAAENAKEAPTKAQQQPQKPAHAEGDQEKQPQQKHQQKGQGKGNDRGQQNQRHQQEKGAQPQQNGTAPGNKHNEGKGEEADPQLEKQEAPERKVSVAQQERQRMREINESLDKLEAELSLINLETMSHSVATSDLRSAIQEKREQGAEVGTKVRSLQKEKGELNKKRMEAEGLKKKRDLALKTVKDRLPISKGVQESDIIAANLRYIDWEVQKLETSMAKNTVAGEDKKFENKIKNMKKTKTLVAEYQKVVANYPMPDESHLAELQEQERALDVKLMEVLSEQQKHYKELEELHAKLRVKNEEAAPSQSEKTELLAKLRKLRNEKTEITLSMRNRTKQRKVAKEKQEKKDLQKKVADEKRLEEQERKRQPYSSEIQTCSNLIANLTKLLPRSQLHLVEKEKAKEGKRQPRKKEREEEENKQEESSSEHASPSGEQKSDEQEHAAEHKEEEAKETEATVEHEKKEAEETEKEKEKGEPQAEKDAGEKEEPTQEPFEDKAIYLSHKDYSDLERVSLPVPMKLSEVLPVLQQVQAKKDYYKKISEIRKAQLRAKNPELYQTPAGATTDESNGEKGPNKRQRQNKEQGGRGQGQAKGNRRRNANPETQAEGASEEQTTAPKEKRERGGRRNNQKQGKQNEDAEVKTEKEESKDEKVAENTHEETGLSVSEEQADSKSAVHHEDGEGSTKQEDAQAD